MNDKGMKLAGQSNESQRALALMRKLLGEEEASQIEALLENPLFNLSISVDPRLRLPEEKEPQSNGGFEFSRDSKEFQQGMSLMRRVLGEKDAGQIEGILDHPLFGDSIGWAFSKSWGALYHRDQLSIRDRALILIGSDLALSREGPLRDHLRVALYSGMSPRQIVEVLFQAALYVGIPSMVFGLKVAMGVLEPYMQAHATREVQTMKDTGIRLGPINHVAMVVHDWKKAARNYASLLGLKTWRVLTIGPEMMTSSEYYGEPAEYSFLCAFAKLGDTLIELNEHVSGRTVWKDHLEQHGEGMQHVGDLSYPKPLELVEAYKAQGVKVGNYCNIGGVAEIFFLDTREQLGGMFLEVVSPPSMAQIANFGEDFTFE